MDEVPYINRIDPYNKTASLSEGREPLPFQQRDASRVRLASMSHERGHPRAPLVTVSYFNYLERDVVVTSRNGTAIVVPPLTTYNGDEFIVCVTHTMEKCAMEKALDTLKNRANPDERESSYWIRAYEGALYNGTMTMLTASVEYVVYYRDITDASGRCYMSDVDLLLEWVTDRGATHPFDKVKRDQNTLQAVLPDVSEAACVFMIKAVDNAHQVQRGTRYVNLGGEVFVVPIERNFQYETGIHIVSRKPVTDGTITNDVIHRTYTFEEADVKFGLHRTVEDCLNGGPMTEMAKTLLEHDTISKRMRESELRNNQLEVDAELQRLRNIAARGKVEQDLESTQRRNYLEWVKTGVAIVGAAITLYGILSKLTAKT